MTWTAQKTAKGFDGQVWVQALFTDQTTRFYESYRADSITPDWPDAIIRGRLDRLNALDLSTVPLGDIAVAPVIKPVDPPTPEQQAQSDFLALCDSYRKTKAQVLGGLGKVTQADLDGIAVQIKSTFIEAYAPFIVGLF